MRTVLFIAFATLFFYSLMAEKAFYPSSAQIGQVTAQCMAMDGQVDIVRDRHEGIDAINCLTPRGVFRLYTTERVLFLPMVVRRLFSK